MTSDDSIARAIFEANVGTAAPVASPSQSKQAKRRYSRIIEAGDPERAKNRELQDLKRKLVRLENRDLDLVNLYLKLYQNRSPVLRIFSKETREQLFRMVCGGPGNVTGDGWFLLTLVKREQEYRKARTDARGRRRRGEDTSEPVRVSTRLRAGIARVWSRAIYRAWARTLRLIAE